MQSTTLSDFPGRVAAILFTPGCTFRCPFCHNPDLVLPERIRRLDLTSQDDALSRLKERSDFLDGIVVTGGEPTVHRDLPTFLEQVRQIGLQVKLDTNGVHPRLLGRLLDSGLVDYVAMDIKGPAARYGELAGVHVDLAAIRTSVQLIIDHAPQYEFRTTAAPTLTEEQVMDAAEMVAGGERFVLQEFAVPQEGALVDPKWADMPALPGEKLLRLQERMQPLFPSVETRTTLGGTRTLPSVEPHT